MTTMTHEPATEKQLQFIRSLLVERCGRSNGIIGAYDPAQASKRARMDYDEARTVVGLFEAVALPTTREQASSAITFLQQPAMTIIGHWLDDETTAAVFGVADYVESNREILEEVAG